VSATAAERKAAVEEKRAAMRAELEEARAEQEATDLEALVDLEAEHGFDRILRVNLRGWKKGVGAATMVIARVPERKESFFKRFEQTISKAKEGSGARLDALHALAEACIVYPNKKTQKELYDATMELASGITSHVGSEIVNWSQGKAAEEKKDAGSD
jgi:hypothetical protein